MKAIGPTTSEELRSQSITVLKKHEKSPISLTKIVESKWWDNMINYIVFLCPAYDSIGAYSFSICPIHFVNATPLKSLVR
jgi:hypothetical protein